MTAAWWRHDCRLNVVELPPNVTVCESCGATKPDVATEPPPHDGDCEIENGAVGHDGLYCHCAERAAASGHGCRYPNCTCTGLQMGPDAGYVERHAGGCCSAATAHASDCATNRDPALPVGPCDCGWTPLEFYAYIIRTLGLPASFKLTDDGWVGEGPFTKPVPESVLQALEAAGV